MARCSVLRAYSQQPVLVAVCQNIFSGKGVLSAHDRDVQPREALDFEAGDRDFLDVRPDGEDFAVLGNVGGQGDVGLVDADPGLSRQVGG